MSVNEKMTAIADAIRAKTGHTEKLGLDAMAAAVPQVYEAGYTAGEESQAGQYEAGRQAQYDSFWDTYQHNGSRTNYDRDFNGTGWTTQTFRPKYDIKPTGALQSIFRGSNIQGDLPAICGEQGITIDFSGATSGTEWFFQSKFTHIGTVDTRGVANLYRFFSMANSLVTVDNIILKEDGTQTTADFLYSCRALENLTITGTIGYSIDVHNSTKLTRTSIESIVNALSDTATGQTLTLSETAVNTAFGDENNYGMDTAQWGQLCDSKPNWTITLM